MDIEAIERAYYEKAKNSANASTLDAFIKKAKKAGQGAALEAELYEDFNKQFLQAKKEGKEPKLTFERELEGKKEEIIVPFEWYKATYKKLGEEAIAKKDRKVFEEIKKEASKVFNLHTDKEIASFFDFKTEWLNTKDNQKQNKTDERKKKSNKATLEDEYLSEAEKLNVVKKEIINEVARYLPLNSEEFEDLESEVDRQIAICMRKGGMKTVQKYRENTRKGFAIFRNEFNKAVMNEQDKMSEEIFVAEKEERTKFKYKDKDKIK